MGTDGKRHHRAWLLAIPFLLLLIGGSAAWWNWSRPRPAPDITVQTLDGVQLALAEQRGKVMLVNFWATTCSVCMKEMPELVATHRKYAPQGFQTLALAMHYDNPAWVSDFQAAAKLPFFVAHDVNGQAADAFGGIVGTPITLLIDKRGQVVQRYIGMPNFEKMHTLIEGLLAEPA